MKIRNCLLIIILYTTQSACTSTGPARSHLLSFDELGSEIIITRLPIGKPDADEVIPDKAVASK